VDDRHAEALGQACERHTDATPDEMFGATERVCFDADPLTRT
jgi:hypothetical protein